VKGRHLNGKVMADVPMTAMNTTYWDYT
jgi:hypothetical protein